MTTTSLRTVGAIFSAGILLTSCVSSKKYHKSLDEVARLKADSTSLAQKGTSLQQNLTDIQQKNADLQKSVETAGTTNASLTKNVAYYHDFADKQQASTTQIKGELNTTLASAGITDQDVTLTDGKIYVNIAEKSLFKGNTAVLTAKGKELVDNLGQFVKSHEAVDVSVADLQQATSVADNGATGNTGAMATTTGTDQNATGTTGSGNTSTKSKSNSDNNVGVAADKTAHRTAVVHHKKKIQATSGESKAVAYSSNHHNKYTRERSIRSAARAMAWKRQNTVADALLKNGIPKVKVVAQNQPGTESTGTQKGVQVILVNNMDEFYKHMSEAPSGQPVTTNP